MTSLSIPVIVGALCLISGIAFAQDGSNCHTSSQCSESGNDYECWTNPQCDYGTCQCKDGYVYSSKVDSCVEKDLKVGDTYIDSAQCDSDKFMSFNSTTYTCICMQDFSGSVGDSECTWGTLVNLGSAAARVTLCQAYKFSYEQYLALNSVYDDFFTDPGVVINGGNCECSTGWKAEGQTCVPDGVPPGQSCSTTSDCDVHNYVGVQCVSSVCNCPTGKRNAAVYVHPFTYDYYCVDDNALINIFGGESCKTSTAVPETYCASGFRCDTCPEDYNPTCIAGASVAFVSLSLLMACLLALTG